MPSVKTVANFLLHFAHIVDIIGTVDTLSPNCTIQPIDAGGQIKNRKTDQSQCIQGDTLYKEKENTSAKIKKITILSKVTKHKCFHMGQFISLRGLFMLVSSLSLFNHFAN